MSHDRYQMAMGPVLLTVVLIGLLTIQAILVFKENSKKWIFACAYLIAAAECAAVLMVPSLIKRKRLLAPLLLSNLVIAVYSVVGFISQKDDYLWQVGTALLTLWLTLTSCVYMQEQKSSLGTFLLPFRRMKGDNISPLPLSPIQMAPILATPTALSPAEKRV